MILRMSEQVALEGAEKGAHVEEKGGVRTKGEEGDRRPPTGRGTRTPF